jgi:hypothetical protein
MLYKIDHGLGCTEIMVRLWRSNMKAKVIEERFFYRCGCVPEMGFFYPNGKMILIEFSTENDFTYNNRLKGKLAAYSRHLWQINEKFSSDSIVVFVLDVPRDRVENFVSDVKPVKLPVFFTDFESFKNVPVGKQLSAPIYIWGEDGKSYPLTKDAQL